MSQTTRISARIRISHQCKRDETEILIVSVDRKEGEKEKPNLCMTDCEAAKNDREKGGPRYKDDGGGNKRRLF
jgi:hypothetical protein